MSPRKDAEKGIILFAVELADHPESCHDTAFMSVLRMYVRQWREACVLEDQHKAEREALLDAEIAHEHHLPPELAREGCQLCEADRRARR